MKADNNNLTTKACINAFILQLSQSRYSGGSELQLLKFIIKVIGEEEVCNIATQSAENFDRLRTFAEMSGMNSLVSSLDNGVGKVFYEKRNELEQEWKRNINNYRPDSQSSLLAATKYVLTNHNTDWKPFYNLFKKMNERTWYFNANAFKYEQTILAIRDYPSFEKQMPKSKKGVNGKKRGGYHYAYIAAGKADKKFIRKMRSETSSDASLSALCGFIDYKHLYPKFNEWITQFNDSKHECVINKLMDIYDNEQLLGLLGNPLANKVEIRKRLS